MSKSIKEQSRKIKKECNHCFEPTHLKFNFSFITYDKNLSTNLKSQLLDRIIFLSNMPMLILIGKHDKKVYLEVADKSKLGISKQISDEFEEKSSHRRIGKKYTIFRLYPNNEPICARIIGEVIRNVFYIFYIDIGCNLYDH
ncbi:MAG TPA: hypothetical protein DCP90_05855 [Clostridiales bacterium]|nr:MAG: hypothetical protein A2Y22_04820 [Clostridiales bacterium GWD2_32_59]HAN10118.1 hypothetical protein [Clostridiales bacterium]